MAFDDNPDEVFEEEGMEGEAAAGNGDEQSNRSFRTLMIALGAIGAIGVLFIGAIWMSRQGSSNQFAATNQAIQQTNEAIAQLALNTPTPAPTDTRAPTNTATPTKPPTPVPSPTPQDIVTALGSRNFTTLTALLTQSGLLDTLKSGGPFTLLAPSDEAFAQLPPASLEELSNDPEKLAALLKYHVIEGIVNQADASKSPEAKTLEGQPVKIVMINGRPTFNDASITSPNIPVANGLVHGIDRVLAPPDVAEIVKLIPTRPAPAATTVAGTSATPAPTRAGATAIAQAGAATVVPTRVPPQGATATKAAAAARVTGTPAAAGSIPKAGAGEDLLVWMLAALGLVGVFVIARRLRTASS
jgi:uncharacterized surface protein with fasciclin (FAS1) repeats